MRQNRKSSCTHHQVYVVFLPKVDRCQSEIQNVNVCVIPTLRTDLRGRLPSSSLPLHACHKSSVFLHPIKPAKVLQCLKIQLVLQCYQAVNHFKDTTFKLKKYTISGQYASQKMNTVIYYFSNSFILKYSKKVYGKFLRLLTEKKTASINKISS